MNPGKVIGLQIVLETELPVRSERHSKRAEFSIGLQSCQIRRTDELVNSGLQRIDERVERRSILGDIDEYLIEPDGASCSNEAAARLIDRVEMVNTDATDVRGRS